MGGTGFRIIGIEATAPPQLPLGSSSRCATGTSMAEALETRGPPLNTLGRQAETSRGCSVLHLGHDVLEAKQLKPHFGQDQSPGRFSSRPRLSDCAPSLALVGRKPAVGPRGSENCRGGSCGAKPGKAS